LRGTRRQKVSTLFEGNCGKKEFIIIIINSLSFLPSFSLLTGMSSPSKSINFPPAKYSFQKEKIKILLLENINVTAYNLFKREGFQVDCLTGTLPPDELKKRISDAHAIGIRSRTKLTDEIIAAGKRLLTIGCFCIGTDQVDLSSAQCRGIPVFNSPFCNSRSVAELIISEVIALSRQLCDRVREVHEGTWQKSARNCREVRGKTLGIIGYGHIGSQLSVLAESMGMRVIFYDIESVMPLGNAVPTSSMSEVLSTADFVTLHVPDTESTRNMITSEQIALMKPGAFLLNASRGSVVDLSALASALKTGHLGGAAVDVYPEEPETNTNKTFETPLRGCPNTILTPHIGGSTEEAQVAIAEEVTRHIIDFINSGKTKGAVNFPELELKFGHNHHRILNVHRNVPGVLKSINNILSDYNIVSQVLDTQESIGYLIVDVDKEASRQIKEQIAALDKSIKTRILF